MVGEKAMSYQKNNQTIEIKEAIQINKLFLCTQITDDVYEPFSKISLTS